MNAWEAGETRLFTENLTSREKEILALIEKNLSSREIASQLHLSYSTVKWYTQQIYGKLGANNKKEALTQAQSLGLLVNEGSRSHRKDNLPAEVTPFWGRQDEQKILVRMLYQPDVRLISVVGPGGTGKTRLALQIASQLIKRGAQIFSDGLFFVNLAPVGSSTFLITAIAEALSFNFFDSKQDQERQLLGFLKHKHLLLLLDNFEHLINEPGLKILSELLEGAGGLKILVTTRSQLGMQGENVYPLLGLEIPRLEDIQASQNPLEEVNRYSSIQMFVHRASMRRPDFTLTEKSLVPVVRICRALQGMPLGIELATAWLGIMEPASILTRIEQSLDFLEEKDFSVPERQRSLRAVFDASWELLDENERIAVKTLSVFRSGFCLQAAEQTGDVTLVVLRSLTDKSWIQRVGEDRYQIHELLRQYGEEMLYEDEVLFNQTKEKYCDYFCGLLQSLDNKWEDAYQLEALHTVENDLQNFQHAWHLAVAQANITYVNSALDSLCVFYEWRGRFQDGEAACKEAIESFKYLVNNGKVEVTELSLLYARLLIWQSIFTNDPEHAGKTLQQSRTILYELESTNKKVQQCQAFLNLTEGELYIFKDRQHAFSCYEQSLSLAKDAGHEFLLAKALYCLGSLNWLTGSFDEGNEFLHRSLSIMRRVGNKRWIGVCLSDLAIVSKHRGDLRTAEQQHLESIEIHKEIGDHLNQAISLIDFASTLEWEGKFEDSLHTVIVAQQIFQDLGYIPASLEPQLFLVIAGNNLSLGNYGEAKDFVQRGLALAKRQGNQQQAGFFLRYLGKLELVDGHYHEAKKYFQESLSVLLSVKQNIAEVTHADLALAARMIGISKDSIFHVRQALKKAHQLHSGYMICCALPVAALILVDLGQYQRAVEIYSLASTYLHVNQSKWLEDVAGRELRLVSLSMKPELAEKCWQTGKILPVWETVESLIEEFDAHNIPAEPS